MNFSEIIYWVLFFLSLLNYGAVEIFTVAVALFFFSLLLVLSIVVLGMPAHTMKAGWAAVGLAFAALLVVWLQTTPLPGGVLAAPAWQDLSNLGVNADGLASLTPADDWASVLRLLLPTVLFLLGLVLFKRDEHALRAINILAISGGGVAFFSILQFLIWPENLLFGQKPAYFDSLTGFFVNRNTAATYFGLITLLTFGILTHHLQRLDRARILQAVEARRAVPGDQRKALFLVSLYISLFVVTVMALVLTGSRAGIGSSFLALILLLVLALARPNYSRRGIGGLRSERRPFLVLALSVAAVVVAGLTLVSLAGRAVLRAEQQGLEDGRFCTLPSMVSAALDHLPLGAGLASFQVVFPGYRSAVCGMRDVWVRAHNVYLETLLTMGMGGASLLLLAVCLLFIGFWRGFRRRRRLRYVAEIGLAALLLVAVHSALDFSIQISGLAMFYAALSAALVSVCLERSANSGRHPMVKGRFDKK